MKRAAFTRKKHGGGEAARPPSPPHPDDSESRPDPNHLLEGVTLRGTLVAEESGSRSSRSSTPSGSFSRLSSMGSPPAPRHLGRHTRRGVCRAAAAQNERLKYDTPSDTPGAVRGAFQGRKSKGDRSARDSGVLTPRSS